MNAELEKRTVEQYVKKLDPFKLYLLKSDHQKIKGMMSGIFKKVEKKKCDSLFKAREIYINAVKKRIEFVKNYLGPKFKYNKKTKLSPDPDKREYAKNLKASLDYHKKYLQFQVSNNMAAGSTLKEANDDDQTRLVDYLTFCNHKFLFHFFLRFYL